MSKTDKYARMSQQLHKAKIQRVKDVQDEWKSQFIDPKSEQQQPHPSIKKTSNIHSTVVHEGQQEAEQADPQELQNRYDEQFRQQKYAEVDGRRIYIAGLDIKLLQQQKQQLQQQKTSQRSDLLNRISQKVRIAESVNKVAHNKLYRQMVGRIFNPTDQQQGKPKLDLNSYYVFDVDKDFGRAVPQLAIKRLGKFHKHPVFPAISSDRVSQLAEMLERNSKRRQLMMMFSMARQQEPEELPAEPSEEDDSDE